MRKKVLAMGLSLVVTAGLLVGCGSSEASSTEESTAAEESTESEETVETSEVASSEESETEEEPEEQTDLYVFIAASLANSMEEIKAAYEADHPEVNIIYNADSSGTLQTQIEEGASCDIFFSAATKQMTALVDEGLVDESSVTNLLENKVVIIKPTGGETAVTGFENITDAANLALAGEDVPVGQYAREIFKNIGNLDDVMAMEINEGANVTAVLAAVAEGSNEVGVVYATDAASMPDDVEIICEATAEQVDPAIYPIGLVNNEQATEAEKAEAEDFLTYLTTDSSVMDTFVAAGFSAYTE